MFDFSDTPTMKYVMAGQVGFWFDCFYLLFKNFDFQINKSVVITVMIIPCFVIFCCYAITFVEQTVKRCMGMEQSPLILQPGRNRNITMP